MIKLWLRLGFMSSALLLLSGVPALAQDNLIKLMTPDFSAKGKTVMQAVKDRQSDRVFSSEELSLRQMSEAVWAAAGINRPGNGEKPGRTAPSSNNAQAITAYVFIRDGVYKYDPVKHELTLVLAGDHRATAGIQSYVAGAPLNLILVADMGLVPGETEQDKFLAVGMDVGHMSENVYLYAASAELNVICRSHIDRDEIRALLKLGRNFEPLLGVTVGRPQ